MYPVYPYLAKRDEGPVACGGGRWCLSSPTKLGSFVVARGLHRKVFVQGVQVHFTLILLNHSFLVLSDNLSDFTPSVNG